jgi:hypothetical protein
MEIRLHPAGTRPNKTRRPAPAGWRAGLPVKRFFTRFRSVADMPPEDLDLLAEHIRLALDVSQEANITALHATLRAALRNRQTEKED